MTDYENLCKTVIEKEGYTVEEILGTIKKRDDGLKFTRQLCMYFGRRVLGITFAASGAYFGKDHATAMHACKQVNNLMDTDKRIYEKVADYIALFDNQKGYSQERKYVLEIRLIAVPKDPVKSKNYHRNEITVSISKLAKEVVNSNRYLKKNIHKQLRKSFKH